MKNRLIIVFLVMFAGVCWAEGGFVFIKGGELPLSGKEKNSAVKINDLYWSAYKTTVADWMEYVTDEYKEFNFEKVLNYVNSTNKKWNIEARSQYPITGITWFEAVKYCNWKSKKEGRKPVYLIKGNLPFKLQYLESDIIPTVTIDETANGYRLPTSHEWEYGAKGGAENLATGWWKSVDLLQYGYFAQNSGMDIKKVGMRIPNPCGLYDVVGLAYEWCWGIVSDAAEYVNTRVIRGASYESNMNSYPPVFKNGDIYNRPGKPDYFSEPEEIYGLERNLPIGIRLVTTMPPPTDAK